MALTVCYALLGSLLLSLTLIPALATYLFRRPTRRSAGTGRSRPSRRGTAEPSAPVVDRAGWVVARGRRCVVGGALYLGGSLGTEFLPQLDEGVIWIRANLPAGISLEKSAEMARQIRLLIRESPEVKLVASQTGRNDSGTDPFGPNRNELLVDLRPYDTWRAGRTKAGLVDELARRLTANIPGAAFNFTQPIIDTATEIVTGSSADLAVIISGPDLRELRTPGPADARRAARGCPARPTRRSSRRRTRRSSGSSIDRCAVARYGINVSDVQDVIDLALGGAPISGVFEGERRFDVVARFAPEARANPAAIGALLIPTRDGARVPLAELADIRTSDGATHHRPAREPARDRGAHEHPGARPGRVRRRGPGALRRTRSSCRPATRVDWGGQFENFARARAAIDLHHADHARR